MRSLLKSLVFFFTLLDLTSTAQNFSISIPSSFCTNGIVSASVSLAPAGAANYVWSSNPPSQITGASSSASQVAILFSGCGTGTLYCNAYNSSSSLVGSTSTTYAIGCPGATITPSSQTICPGGSATLTSSSATSYSWSNNATTSSIVVSPSATNVYSLTVNSGSCQATATVSIFGVSVTASSTSICPLTSATLSALGAGSYTWLSSPNNTLQSGSTSSVVVSPAALPATYTVTGTFGTSCAASKTITLVTRQLSPAVTVPSSVCAGVSNTVYPAPVPGTSYTWQSSTQLQNVSPFTFSQAAASSYTLKADSAGCTGIRIFSVGMHPQPSLTITTPVSIICANQQTTLYVSGAASYTWGSAPGLQSSPYGPYVEVAPLSTTVYSVSGVNTQGCRASASFTVILAQYPALSTTVTSFSVCPGFTSTMSVSGANSFRWRGTSFPGAINISSISAGAGTYTVWGSNGGTCEDSLVLVITPRPPLQIATAMSASSTCIQANGIIEPVALTASGASYYTWSPYVQGQMSFSIGPSTAVAPTVTTCYTVTGTTTDCSGKTTICIASGYCTGLEDFAAGGDLSVFPNPASGFISVHSTREAPITTEIFDLNGELKYSELSPVSSGNATIDLGNLPAGIYILRITEENRLQRNFKILKH